MSTPEKQSIDPTPSSDLSVNKENLSRRSFLKSEPGPKVKPIHLAQDPNLIITWTEMLANQQGTSMGNLKEWEHVQTYLLTHIPTPSAYPLATWREKIAEDIARCTGGNVQIWWEPVASEYTRESDLCKDVCSQQTRYGVLKFAPGYLSSALFPNLPQMLADLCGHLLSLVEHQAMIQALQRTLRPLHEHEREMLTKREWDVLQQMLLGESETEIARTLNISLTTVRTHRHHIYQRLGVHSPHEAILRSFELGLGNWLDAPCTTTSHASE